eukprot:5651963-Prymnesium_polylepis.1
MRAHGVALLPCPVCASARARALSLPPSRACVRRRAALRAVPPRLRRPLLCRVDRAPRRADGD